MKNNYLFGALFALVFSGLIALLAFALGNNPSALDLATRNTKIPAFSLPALLSDKALTNADLTSKNPYYLVNFWGSWCPSCYKEHAYLMKLGKRETLYGVNWRDDRSDGKDFVQSAGNPYKKIIVDNDSILAIGMGVYGAPETFLVRADGTILYRYAGMMSQLVWEQEFVPLIKTLSIESREPK